MWFHWCESFMLLNFFLFWNFVPYLLLFQGIKNFMAVLRSSQNSGDPEKTPLRGEERYVIVVQDFCFSKNSMLKQPQFSQLLRIYCVSL